MDANSNVDADAELNRYADMDFSDAKRVAEVHALAALQARSGGKSQIAMRGALIA